MAYQCDYCRKSTQVGSTHKHKPGVAGGRWRQRAHHLKKLFRPNLQRATFMIDSVQKQMRVCTKCLRILKKKYATPYSGSRLQTLKA